MKSMRKPYVIVGVLALLLIGLAVVSSTTKKTTLHNFQVLASEVWTRTSLEIPDDSTIKIEAKGTISPNRGTTYIDASGSTDENWVKNYNLYPEINHCALIAKIGPGGKVHFMGVSQTIQVEEGGELIL